MGSVLASEEKMNNIADANKLRQLEESEQWLENVDQVGCKKVYTSSEFQSKTGALRLNGGRKVSNFNDLDYDGLKKVSLYKLNGHKSCFCYIPNHSLICSQMKRPIIIFPTTFCHTRDLNPLQQSCTNRRYFEECFTD